MGHFVKEQYSVMALSGHVRELEKQHERSTGEKNVGGEYLLPREVASALNCEPKFSVIALEVQS
jgi:DNA topoisomerase IA